MGAIDVLEEDLRIASKILEWEMGDIWGHVGSRVPGSDTIAVKVFRPPEEPGVHDWFVRFDYALNKLSGVGTVPMEAAIYSEVFKARPDVNAITHCHAPMCVVLSMAGKTVYNLHQQSQQFGRGVPLYPDPIFIIDSGEGADLARSLGNAPAVIIKGHGIVTVGKTIDDACITALYLERTAKMQTMAHMIGYVGPTEEFLQSIQMTWGKLQARARELGKGSEIRHSATWSYYADKVHKGQPWNRGWT
ncbi:MAG: class II aldolase/adducin family protein [Desulfobacterales bacterium]|nr:class II aldolase/adducin family protein [Desulfobacterales bacterium]